MYFLQYIKKNDLCKLIFTQMCKHLNYDNTRKETLILQSILDTANFHRGEHERTSTSIMRRLVEDVTGKKIEHLIKKALSEGPGLPLRRNVQLVRGVRRTACRIRRIPGRRISENPRPTTLIRVRYRTRSNTGHRRIVNSMLYKRMCVRARSPR